uniref:Uncharacterized protein n=1 Tax=mine drainage metagenome TaxID=410659 RepID=E6Q1T4_9ZZZZ
MQSIHAPFARVPAGAQHPPLEAHGDYDVLLSQVPAGAQHPPLEAALVSHRVQQPVPAGAQHPPLEAPGHREHRFGASRRALNIPL